MGKLADEHSFIWMMYTTQGACNSLSLSLSHIRYMGIGLSAQGVNMNRLPGNTDN